MPAKAITIAQQKGGAGKTTLAAQLAVAWHAAGRRVALLDVDPQGSLTAWGRVRLERVCCGPKVIEVAGWKMSTELDRMKRDFDIVVIDSPPHAETDARVAVRAADLVLMPVQPSPMDLWAIAPTLELARKEKTRVLLVLNRMPSRGRLPDAILGHIESQSLPLAQSRLGNRVSFAASMMEGRGVVETAPRDPAAGEIRALAMEIDALLGGKA
ncbi:MAG: ParA family protein [Alphaproteobacteria bacterium]|nr:ParA family protein [Alphaproteobacteria bacterium]